MMAFTPGTVSAVLISIRRSRPYVIGLLTTLAQSIPASVTSAVYFAAPVTFSMPSTLGVDLPITWVIQLSLPYQIFSSPHVRHFPPRPQKRNSYHSRLRGKIFGLKRNG